MSAILRASILLMLAILLAYLIITGELNDYINPRLNYLIIFSLVSLLILGVIQMKNLRKRSIHRIGVWGYVMICFPIFFFLLFPGKSSDASLADQKVLTYVSPNQVTKEAVTGTENNTIAQPQIQKVEEEDWKEPYKQKAAQLIKEPVIEITNENYIEVSNIFMLFPDQFVGKKIRTKGFVYREESFTDTQFVVARLAVACCVADAGVVGFLIDSPIGDTFLEDQWYQIEGIFEIKKSKLGDVPGLTMQNYKRVAAPKDSYVYQPF